MLFIDCMSIVLSVVLGQLSSNDLLKHPELFAFPIYGRTWKLGSLLRDDVDHEVVSGKQAMRHAFRLKSIYHELNRSVWVLRNKAQDFGWPPGFLVHMLSQPFTPESVFMIAQSAETSNFILNDNSIQILFDTGRFGDFTEFLHNDDFRVFQYPHDYRFDPKTVMDYRAGLASVDSHEASWQRVSEDFWRQNRRSNQNETGTSAENEDIVYIEDVPFMDMHVLFHWFLKYGGHLHRVMRSFHALLLFSYAMEHPNMLAGARVFVRFERDFVQMEAVIVLDPDTHWQLFHYVQSASCALI